MARTPLWPLNNFLKIGPGGTLDLNGNSQYVQGLFTDGGVTNNSTATAGGTLTNSSGTQATFTLNSDNTARNWAGTISGNIYFDRAGLNTTTMYTPQTYTGATLINGSAMALRDYATLANTTSIDINQATCSSITTRRRT